MPLSNVASTRLAAQSELTNLVALVADEATLPADVTTAIADTGAAYGAKAIAVTGARIDPVNAEVTDAELYEGYESLSAEAIAAFKTAFIGVVAAPAE